MSYVAEFAKFESIGEGARPLVKLVVLPSVVDRLNLHSLEFPDDSIFTDWQGGAIIRSEQVESLPDKSLGSILLRQCVQYADIALSCEGIRFTGPSNRVVGTVIPEQFDNLFLVNYQRRLSGDRHLERKMSLLSTELERSDADKLRGIADRYETLLGDVFTYGYEFRSQVMAARSHHSEATMLSPNGDVHRLLLL